MSSGLSRLHSWRMMKNKYAHGRFCSSIPAAALDGPKEKFDNWEKLFDEIWASDENADTRDIDGVNIYMLNAKILLQEIFADEKDSGDGLVFADNALCCEKKFEGMIDGCYKITGRSDRIADIAGRTEVIDFKYSKKQSTYDVSGRTTVQQL